MTFVEKLKDATIGFSGYPRLARDSRGGFGYVAMLLALVIAINGYLNLVQLRRMAEEMARYLSRMPEFGITEGRFYFAGEMPYVITAGDGSELIIDTTGKTTPESLAGKRAALVTADRYYVIDPSTGTRQVDFALLGADLGKQELIEVLALGPGRLIVLVYPILYLLQLGAKVADAAILALMGMLYGRAVGRQVPFDLGLRVGLYAISLPTIIQWVWTGFHTWTARGFVIWWSLAALYLIFGLRAYLRAQEASLTAR